MLLDMNSLSIHATCICDSYSISSLLGRSSSNVTICYKVCLCTVYHCIITLSLHYKINNILHTPHTYVS